MLWMVILSVGLSIRLFAGDIGTTQNVGQLLTFAIDAIAHSGIITACALFLAGWIRDADSLTKLPGHLLSTIYSLVLASDLVALIVPIFFGQDLVSPLVVFFSARATLCTVAALLSGFLAYDCLLLRWRVVYIASFICNGLQAVISTSLIFHLPSSPFYQRILMLNSIANYSLIAFACCIGWALVRDVQNNVQRDWLHWFGCSILIMLIITSQLK